MLHQCMLRKAPCSPCRPSQRKGPAQREDDDTHRDDHQNEPAPKARSKRAQPTEQEKAATLKKEKAASAKRKFLAVALAGIQVGLSGSYVLAHPGLASYVIGAFTAWHATAVVNNWDKALRLVTATGGLTAGVLVLTATAPGITNIVIVGANSAAAFGSMMLDVAPFLEEHGLSAVFHDPAAATSLMVGWTVLCVGAVGAMGMLPYLHVGPSPDVSLLGVAIDNWSKWSAVAAFSVVNTVVSQLGSNVVSPWYINTVADHKGKEIPQSPAQVYSMILLYSTYTGLQHLMFLYIAFTQADFLAMELGVTLAINTITTKFFLDSKANNAAEEAELEKEKEAEKLAEKEKEKEKSDLHSAKITEIEQTD